MSDYSEFFPTAPKASDYSSFFPPDDNMARYKGMSRPVPVNPTDDMTTTERLGAGAGKWFVDRGRGVAQRLGGGPTPEELQEIRSIDAPLMRTPAGAGGNIGTAVTTMAPLSVIPGAASYRGAAMIGAGAGATEPSGSAAETAFNIGGGALAGIGGQYVGNRIASSILQRPQTAPIDRIAREGRESGYAIPPTQTNPSIFNRALEGFSGKLTTAQQASSANQAVTNKLAAEAVGLPTDQPITVAALERVREGAGKAYKDIADLDPTAAVKLEELKTARFSAKEQFNHYNKSGSPEAGQKARQASADAQRLESEIEQMAIAMGRPELVQNLRSARQVIAKTHTVESALNDATGNVDIRVLARQLDQGKPLTGPLKQAGEFGMAFPKAGQSPEQMGSLPGISPLDVATSGIFGGVGAYAADDPRGAMAALIPFLRPAVRAGILSGAYQGAMGARGSSLAGNLIPGSPAATDAMLNALRGSPIAPSVAKGVRVVTPLLGMQAPFIGR